MTSAVALGRECLTCFYEYLVQRSRDVDNIVPVYVFMYWL